MIEGEPYPSDHDIAIPYLLFSVVFMSYYSIQYRLVLCNLYAFLSFYPFFFIFIVRFLHFLFLSLSLSLSFNFSLYYWLLLSLYIATGTFCTTPTSFACNISISANRICALSMHTSCRYVYLMICHLYSI
jgi:hypothetical protein